MSYIEDITEALIKTLAHTGGLPVHQLAGHAANLEFWVAEVAHAFDVIDGYPQRFKSLQQGEKSYAERQEQMAGGVRRGYHAGPPIKRGTKDQELKDLRRRLADTMYHVLSRCYAEELISETVLEQTADTLGLDVRELKRGKT